MKSIFASKTFWVNSVGGLLIPVLSAYGVQLSAEDVGVVFAAVNIILRLITSVPASIMGE